MTDRTLDAEARARCGEQLRALMQHVDINTREAVAKNLCCPQCGGGIDCEWNQYPGREVMAFEIATMSPGILEKYSPYEVVGRIPGEATTGVKCKACPWEVRNGRVMAR